MFFIWDKATRILHSSIFLQRWWNVVSLQSIPWLLNTLFFRPGTIAILSHSGCGVSLPFVFLSLFSCLCLSLLILLPIVIHGRQTSLSGYKACNELVASGLDQVNPQHLDPKVRYSFINILNHSSYSRKSSSSQATYRRACLLLGILTPDEKGFGVNISKVTHFSWYGQRGYMKHKTIFMQNIS